MKGEGMKMGRRAFLASLGAAGAALAVPGGAAAEPRAELATLLDLSKCVGCGACVAACRESNAARYPEPVKPFPTMHPVSRTKLSDWSDKREVDDRLTPYNWLFIQTVKVEHGGQVHELNVPRRCMHCRNAPCANLCPWGAAAREADGSVHIDADICLGGGKCEDVCPWRIPQRQTGVGLYLDLLPTLAGNGVMYKCDRCAPRRAQGLQPACIEACPNEVQTIGPRDEIVRRARELAASMGGYIYGETENGGTNTIYVSPVPFEALNQALTSAKGPGRPGFAAAPDPLANDSMLARAVLAAPLAGLAAGALRIARLVRDDKGDKA